MRTRLLAHCINCARVLPKCQQVGEPCALCKKPLDDGLRRRTQYVGEALIGAYGSGPPERPWPEIKDGPLRGQNIVEGGLKALKAWGRDERNKIKTEWQ